MCGAQAVSTHPSFLICRTLTTAAAVALTPKIHPIDGEDTITRSASATPTPTDDGDSISEHHGSVWSKFKSFEPNPDATFAEEFWRLSKHQRWTPAERRLRRVELFDADFESHFGKDVGSLPDWQEFCRLCSVDPIPDTIAECIEVGLFDKQFYDDANSLNRLLRMSM
jgi:hypothetical protein